MKQKLLNKKRVVITGIGPVSSIGLGKDDIWKNVLAGNTNVELEKKSVDGKLWTEFPLHKMSEFNIADFDIDKDALSWIKDWQNGKDNTDLFYLIAAIKLAIDDSGLDYKKENNDLGIVLSHENYNLTPFLEEVSDYAYEVLVKSKKKISKKDFYDDLYKNCVKGGYDVQPFMPLFHLAKVFNIHNYSLFLCTACASGLYGLESASQIINSGQSKAVIVTAADHPDVYKYVWFRDLGIYSPDGKIRPFSKDSNGLVFGDGGSALILEDYDNAKKRGAHIYAEYMGGGFSLESWQVTVPQVGSNSYQSAMKKAFEQSSIKKDEIDLLCPHGVGSRVIDYYESKAITDIFGKKNLPTITTFKPYLGHNLASSALLETSILLLAMDHNIVPPTLNCENENPEYGITLLKKKEEKVIRTAMKICCAFAGYNAATIFRKVD